MPGTRHEDLTFLYRLELADDVTAPLLNATRRQEKAIDEQQRALRKLGDTSGRVSDEQKVAARKTAQAAEIRAREIGRAIDRETRSIKELGTSYKHLDRQQATGGGGANQMARRAALAATSYFGLREAISLTAQAIGEASSVQESLTKNQRVFGDSSRQVEQFAQGSARAYGISRKAALEYTGVFGNLTRAQGVSQRESAKLSVGLTTLAADLASFNNTSVDDALEALRSGIVGETEPLRRFGIALSAEAVQAEAARIGIVKLDKSSADYQVRAAALAKAEDARSQALRKFGPESVQAQDATAKLAKAQERLGDLVSGASAKLTPQQKILATNSLVMRQATQARGDFARTSEGLANQERILLAELSDVRVELGTQLLPVVTDGARALSDFVGEMQDGTGAGGAFVDTAKQLGDAIAPAAVNLADAVKAVGGFAAEHPDLAKTAAEFAIIGGAATKIGKLTGAGSLLKIVGFGRGNNPGQPLYVRDVLATGRAPGGTPIPGGGPRTGRLPRPSAGVALLGAAVGAEGVYSGSKLQGALGLGLAGSRFGPWGAVAGAGLGLAGAGARAQDLLKKGDIDSLKEVYKQLGISRREADLLKKSMSQAGGSIKAIDTQKLVDLGTVLREAEFGSRDAQRKARQLAGTINRELAGRMVKDIRGAWNHVQSDTRSSLADVRRTVERNMGRVRDAMTLDSQQGARALHQNITGAIDAISAQMRRGATSVQDGMREIRRLMEQETRSMTATITWGTNAPLEQDGGLPGPGADLPTRKTKRRRRTGGLVFQDGGMVPALVSSGEEIVHHGRSWIVPGPPTAADNVATMLPVGAAVLTFDGQARRAAGATLAEALRDQAPHFAKGGVVGKSPRRGGILTDAFETGMQAGQNRGRATGVLADVLQAVETRKRRSTRKAPATVQGGGNEAVGHRMMLAAGWPESQWPALKALWNGESGWRETARNPSSGAYGIPQALPPGKMGAAAQGTGPAAARAQIAWGLRYIRERYGSPSAALAFWKRTDPRPYPGHWYRAGGLVGYRAGGTLKAATRAATTFQPNALPALDRAIEDATEGRLLQLRRQMLTEARKGGSEKVVKRYQQVVSLIEAQLGRRVGTMLAHIEQRTARIDTSGGFADRALRRAGTDPSSSRGLAAIGRRESREVIPTLQANARDAQRALARAQRGGASSATLRELQGTVNEAIGALDEALTQRAERARDLIRAKARDRVDAAQYRLDHDTADRAFLEASQRVARTDDTPAGIRARAQAVTGSIGGLEQLHAALITQAAALRDTGDIDGWRQAMLAAKAATTDMANAQADAAALIREASDRQTQEALDAATFRTSMAELGLETLQLEQQQLGTQDTAAGRRGRADFIRTTIIPRLEQEVAEDRAALKQALETYGESSQQYQERMLELTRDGNAVRAKQLEADELTAENTERLKDFTGSSVIDTHGDRWVLGSGVGA